MNSFDDEIRDALKFDRDNADLATAGDEGLFEQVAATFRSRMRGWIIMIWIVVLALAVASVFCVYSFFTAEDTRDHILFAIGALLASQMIGHIKLWYYMEMNKNTHTREIKRVELQLARMREMFRKHSEPES